MSISSQLFNGLFCAAAVWACPDPTVKDLLVKCNLGTKYENLDTKQEVEQTLRKITAARVLASAPLACLV